MDISNLKRGWVYSTKDGDKEKLGIFRYYGQTGKPIFGILHQPKVPFPHDFVFCVERSDVTKEIRLATESDY